MLLGELIDAVKSKFVRGDMDGELERKAIQGLRVLHTIADFDMDREEFELGSSEITFQSTENVIGSVAKPPDLRHIEIIHVTDNTGRIIGDPLRRVTLTELAKLRRTRTDYDTYYVSGGRINFKARQRVGRILLSGFVYRPPLSVLTTTGGTLRLVTDPAIQTYTSWILENHASAVEDFVIGHVAAAVGDVELSNHHMGIFDAMHRPALLNLETN